MTNREKNFYERAIKMLDLGEKRSQVSLKNDINTLALHEWRETFTGTPLEDEFEELVYEQEIRDEERGLD